MQKAISKHPRLRSFKLVSMSLNNPHDSTNEQWEFEMRREISCGLAVPKTEGLPLLGMVEIKINGIATCSNGPSKDCNFDATYIARFSFDSAFDPDTADHYLQSEDNQFILISQAFPLAITHFKNQLQASGFDSKAIELSM